VLTLYKIHETFNTYAILFKDFSKEIRGFRKWYKNKNIGEFRNAIVAHIKDKNMEHPHTKAEADLMFQNVLQKQSPTEFFYKINNQKDQGNTIVGLIETVKDSLMERYSISAEEF
jgi:hypothetical protein